MTKTHRKLATALIAAGLIAATAAPANAGTYTVGYCDAANPSAAGWTPSYGGSPWTYYGENCSSGGTMQAWFDSGFHHAQGTVAQWTLTAPADTTFASVSAYREWKANSQQAYGDAHAIIATDKGRIDGCTLVYGCGGIAGNGFWDLSDAQSLTFAVHCTGGNGCPAGEVHNRVKNIALTVRDPYSPTLSDVGGPLSSPNTTARYRSLSYNAADRGGGIYRRRLVINGTAGAPTVIDANGGDCKQPAAKRVPCKLTLSENFTYDTAALPDGSHTVALLVSDITDANTATSPTWTIAVDNQPPTLDAPQITGAEARVGTPLACAAKNVVGQSPSLAYQWLRANPDGSDETPVPDATTPGYTPTETDAGKKLLCRVTATDGGGSTTKTSTLTSGPFASGQTVKTYCAGKTTGPTDPCGDYDADGQPNHADPDDDNDGIADDRDPRPFAVEPTASAPATTNGSNDSGSSAPAEPSTNSTTTYSTSTQTVVVVGSGDGMPVLSHQEGIHGPANNGTGATNKASVLITGSRSRSVAWGRRIATTGRLVNVNGQPITGAVVTIQQRAILPLRRGYAPNSVLQTVGSVKTDANGRFRWLIPAGASREILYTYKANLANTTVQGLSRLRLAVRSKVTLRIDRRTLHNGDTMRLRGTVVSRPLPAAGVVVNLQAHVRGRGWVVFASPRTDSKGRFTARYRFRNTTTTTRYRIRAVTRMDSGAPFLAATSRHARIAVAP